MDSSAKRRSCQVDASENEQTQKRSSLPARSSLRSSIQSKIQSKIDLAHMPPVYKIPLWELNCGFGIVKKKHATPCLLKDCIQRERARQQANVTIVFAIREAG